MNTCNRILVLNFGQKICEGTPETVRNDRGVNEAYFGKGLVVGGGLQQCLTSRTCRSTTAMSARSPTSASTWGKGEVITLIGGNGAGKTTTLMAISNLVEKLEGRITFKGKDITSMAPHRIVKMGICHVPEGRRIFPALTVRRISWREPWGIRPSGKRTTRAFLMKYIRCFPRLKERMNQGRRLAFRRRAADARDRPRPDDGSGTDSPG